MAMVRDENRGRTRMGLLRTRWTAESEHEDEKRKKCRKGTKEQEDEGDDDVQIHDDE